MSIQEIALKAFVAWIGGAAVLSALLGYGFGNGQLDQRIHGQGAVILTIFWPLAIPCWALSTAVMAPFRLGRWMGKRRLRAAPGTAESKAATE